MKITKSFCEMTPAYGRDYSSAKTAKADFLARKDWLLQDVEHGFDRLCSITDFASGVDVNLRYAKQTKVTVVTVP